MSFSILLLGTYGHVGRQVVSGLAQLDCIDRIIAAGRNKEKLNAIVDAMVTSENRDKIELKAFDAFDASLLQDACNDVDLVINAMGPFTNDLGRVARIVIEKRKHYIDIANEQSQYKRLLKLNDQAKEGDTALITGAGTSPGISTLLFMLGASKLQGKPAIMDMYYAAGRHPTKDEAFGSVMGALLETSIGSLALKDGKLVKVNLGDEYRNIMMPEPFGSTKMLEFPTSDSLIMQAAFPSSPLKDVRAFWAMGNVPFGLKTILKMLKPTKRRWGYNLVAKLVRSTMDVEFEKQTSEGIGLDAILKVVVSSIQEDDRWEASISFPRGGGEAALYIPLIYAKLLATGQFDGCGVITPADGIIEPGRLVGFMKELNWTGNFVESTQDP